MQTENIPDVHNRRRNIEYAAKRCRELNYPMLIWPQEVSLIRLDDLPEVGLNDINLPPTWNTAVARIQASFIVRTDEQFRAIVKPDHAYYVSSRPRGKADSARVVVEIAVKSL